MVGTCTISQSAFGGSSLLRHRDAKNEQLTSSGEVAPSEDWQLHNRPHVSRSVFGRICVRAGHICTLLLSGSDVAPRCPAGLADPVWITIVSTVVSFAFGKGELSRGNSSASNWNRASAPSRPNGSTASAIDQRSVGSIGAIGSAHRREVAPELTAAYTGGSPHGFSTRTVAKILPMIPGWIFRPAARC